MYARKYNEKKNVCKFSPIFAVSLLLLKTLDAICTNDGYKENSS